MDYVSRFVSNQHAKFRLSAAVRNQLKKSLKKKKEEKKDKNVARSKIQKKTFFVCESTLNRFFYEYILDLC